MKKLLSLVLTLTLAFSLAAENESSAEEASQPETEAGSAGHCPGGTGERRPPVNRGNRGEF